MDARAGNGQDPSRREQVRTAVTPRAVALVIAVLGLQLGFVASYVGALHAPTPHRIPVSVAVIGSAPAGTAASIAQRLTAIASRPLRATAARSEADAQRAIRTRAVDGAFVVDAGGTTDRLYVSGAEGGGASEALREIFVRVEASQHRTAVVTDLVPAAAEDSRGLSAFYLAVGWIVGGYLVASLMSISAAAPLTSVRAMVRLTALAAYAIVSGIGGVLIVGPGYSALNGSGVRLALLGALVVFAAGAFTTALQALTGTIGIGLAVLLFVVLGNPSAGGAYPLQLLPTFWRTIGPWLPPGAATDSVRGIVYFGGARIGGPLTVLAAYALAGVGVTLADTLLRSRRQAA